MKIVKEPKRRSNCEFFLDGNKGVLLDFSKSRHREKLMLSDVRYLCDNVTSLEEREDGYYLAGYKYLPKEETLKYLDEISTELAKGIIEERTYLCLDHYGKYVNRIETYKKLLETIKLKNYKISSIPIEQYYLNDKESEEKEANYITRIMIPISIDL